MLQANIKPLIFSSTLSFILLTGPGCTSTNHDKDSLYVHGFIAPVGQTALDTVVTQSNAETARPQLSVSLRNGETLISQQTLHTPAIWPAAYKIEFHPPQIADIEGELTLAVSLIAAEQQQTLFQKDIELENKMLFATSQDILIHSSLNSEAAYQQQHASNTDKNDSSDTPLADSVLPAPYEHFECDNDSSFSAYITDTYVILPDAEHIIPRVIHSPTPVYSDAATVIAFSDDAFTVETDKSVYSCDMNDNSYNPAKNIAAASTEDAS